MKRIASILIIALLGVAPAQAARVQPLADELQAQPVAVDLNVDLWLNAEDGAVYREGEVVEIHFQANRDAYVAVYNVDVDGFINLLYPRYNDSYWVHGQAIYSIPGPNSDYELMVDDRKGIEYVVAVASPYPLQLEVLDPVGSNDYRAVSYSGRITGDPSQAIWELNEQLAWGEEVQGSAGYSSAVSWFYVREEVPYPRYLVYNLYRDRYWDPFWDPYLCVGLWVDFYWDHAWCGSHWWWRGHRPAYTYWYRPDHHGPRLHWKSEMVHDHAGSHYREKGPRPASRQARGERWQDTRRKPDRHVESRIRERDEARPPRAGAPVERGVRSGRRRDLPPAQARPARPAVQKPKPRSKPAPRPASKPEVKPESKPEKPPAEKPKPAPEARPKQKSEPKPESRPSRDERGNRGR